MLIKMNVHQARVHKDKMDFHVPNTFTKGRYYPRESELRSPV